MNQKHPSGQRLLRAAGLSAGLTLILLGLAGQSAMAQEAPVHATESLTVVRDPDTGKLRHASAAEQAALQAQAASTLRSPRVAPKAPQQKFHASGARGVRLTDEFISSSVAVRKPDGSIETQCFDSHGAAQSAVTTGHGHTNKVETE